MRQAPSLAAGRWFPGADSGNLHRHKGFLWHREYVGLTQEQKETDVQPHEMTAADVRKLARAENLTTTSGDAAGFMQANLLAVPEEYAFDFLLFAPRDSKPCPIVGV